MFRIFLATLNSALPWVWAFPFGPGFPLQFFFVPQKRFPLQSLTQLTVTKQIDFLFQVSGFMLSNQLTSNLKPQSSNLKLET